jgi:hypothetical protein
MVQSIIALPRHVDFHCILATAAWEKFTLGALQD